MADEESTATLQNDTPAEKRLPFKVYPGIGGMRFRLQAGQQFPQLKEDDPEYAQPQPVADAYARVFDLSNDDDLKEYVSIWDRAAKGEVIISAEERHWSEKTDNFKVFLRWGDVYLEMPKNGGFNHGQQVFR